MPSEGQGDDDGARASFHGCLHRVPAHLFARAHWEWTTARHTALWIERCDCESGPLHRPMPTVTVVTRKQRRLKALWIGPRGERECRLAVTRRAYTEYFVTAPKPRLPVLARLRSRAA
jgi:hypothetical protein